jgi:hypothetical protein
MIEPIYRLSDAAERFFPNGGITPHSLRSEARAGRLKITRIAGKDFVTERDIAEMLEKCRQLENRRDCGSSIEPEENRPGSSKTGRSALALAAANETLQELSVLCSATSPANSSRQNQVVPQRSQSRK